MEGIRHLVECHCVLPQYRHAKDPIFHKFIVFSVIDDDDRVISKLVQCNNCGVLHRVHDICKSEFIYEGEDFTGTISIEDIKLSLPERLLNILEAYNVDRSAWEQAQFVLENKKWNSFIILRSESIEDKLEGKLLRVLGMNLYKVETFSRQIFIENLNGDAT